MKKTSLLFLVFLLPVSCSDSDSSTQPTQDVVDTQSSDVADLQSSDAEDLQPSDLGGEDDQIEITEDTEVLTAGVGYAFFAIHLDPGSVPKDGGHPNTSRPEQCWPTLINLVETADTYAHKLTLMFTGQWGYYFSEAGNCVVPDGAPYSYQGTNYDTCAALVRGFEANGHAIAFHHHPHGNPRVNWDGFSNSPIAQDSPEYLGPVSDAKDYVDALSADGAAGVISGTLEEYPLGGGGINFTSARGPTAYEDADNRGDLASRPCAWAEDNQNVWRLRMRSYTGNSVYDLVRETELTAAINDLAATFGEPWTVGFVTHAVNVFDNSMTPYVALFDALSDAGLTLETLETVERHYDWTAEDAALAGSEHLCPPNEGEIGE